MRTLSAAVQRQQKLRLCVVCGSFLDKNDSDARLADHFGGKLHLGFLAIREKLKDLKTRLDLRRSVRDDDRRPSDPAPDRYRERERDRDPRDRDRDYRDSRGGGGSRRDYSPPRRGGGGSGGDYRRDGRSDRDRERGDRRRSPSPRRY